MMKKIRNRSLIVWLLVMAFIGGMIYFSINLIIHADLWASKPQNAHIGVDGMGMAGTITDINGEILAYSENGNRYYNSNEDIRCALLHTVGDEGRNIGGSVQNVYRSQLSGYSFIFGMGLPDGLTLGRNIQLTVNSEICKTAYQALGNNRGAVFVYNYKTGEIVAKVSTPSYDPQNIPDIEGNDEYEGVYVDRSIMATYPPGSTFKLVTASAALENMTKSELENRTYTCTGSDTIGGNKITCYEAHGEENFEQALAHSCNCYFAQLAVDLGADKMTTQANRMGFNKSVSINDIDTAKSVYDVSKADKNQLGWSGVGQYTTLASPMTMAVISGGIANGGTPIMPYLIKQISLPFGLPNIPQSGNKGAQMLSEQNAKTLSDMMRYTVENEYYGGGFNGEICAKTGTAEVGGGEAAHAWVTGFSRDESCPLAFAVIIENGDSGYYTALPVAAQVMNKALEIYGQ